MSWPRISKDETPLADSLRLCTQAAACTYHLPPNRPYEKALRWFVPAQAKDDTPAGPRPIHDDRLISAALVAVIDDLIQKGHLRTGRTKRVIIPPADPLAN